MTFTLTSPAFDDGGNIPEIYTCEGEDLSPELSWDHPPEGTESFVLICDDHDVPKNLRPDGVWDHWVIFNLPKETRTLPKGVKDLPAGAVVGKNSWNRNDYGGPCPPDREHRYQFKLYALNEKLDLEGRATKKDVEKAMAGHILEETLLMGRYDKKQRRLK